MGNLSSLTMGDTTFPVLANGGGGGSGMIEGEYTIPEVYWCERSGRKEINNPIAGRNVKVWYQKTGKFVRAAMAFAIYEIPTSSTYWFTFGFNRADLFGDGKLFPENAELVFFKFTAYGQLPPEQTNTSASREPYFLLFSTDTGSAGYADLYIAGTHSITSFPDRKVGGMNSIAIEAACL